MTRQFWVYIHRYVGLVMALFLIVAGLTGSILAFYDEIDDWLNPESSRKHTRIAVQDKSPLDAFALYERALTLIPKTRIIAVNLEPQQPGEAYTVYLDPRIDPKTGQPYKLGYFALKLNLYTGYEVKDSRYDAQAIQQNGYFPLTRKTILPLIYALHYQLALGETGALLFGIIAVVWTLDCFVGFYLTLPPRHKHSHTLAERVVNALSRGSIGRTGGGLSDDCMDAGGRATHEAIAGKLNGSAFVDTHHPRPSSRGEGVKGFWQRWKPAWQIKRNASAFRRNYDLHRAFGLWTWLMLFIFAWSSVMFNLPQVCDPVMAALFDMPPEQSLPPGQNTPKFVPVAEFRKAHTIGQRLMSEQAKQHAFSVKHELWLSYDDATGLFDYTVTSDRDVSDSGQTSVTFNASTGKIVQASPLPTGKYSGVTVKNWLLALHMAKVWGLPYKLYVSCIGLVIAMLSVTGIYIWYKKRRAAEARHNCGGLAKSNNSG